MTVLTMSTAAFGATLHLLGCEGRCLLPRNENAETFLAGREELCRNGWAELDFDGSLLPDPVFARRICGLKGCTAAMQLVQDGKTCWLLYTPVEGLLIEQVGETVRLQQLRNNDALQWMRDVVLPAAEGRLITQGPDGKKKSTSLAAYAAGSRQRAEQLARHLCLFYGKEEN